MIWRSDKHEAKSQRAGTGAAGSEGESQLAVHERGPGSTALGRPDLFSASPYALMRRVAEDMDRMFESFGFSRGRLAPRLWSDLPEQFSEPELAAWAPEIEAFDRKGEYVVRADLPGLKKEDVRVEVTENALILEGERRQEHEERREGFYRSERSYGRFSRAVPLPEGVDTEQVKAEFRNGVLEVRIPAPGRQQQQRRQIEISTA